MSLRPIESSFRDPSGFLFTIDDILYRSVTPLYKDHYELLMSSGLYQWLVEKELLIPHSEVDVPEALSEDAYKIIKPDRLPFISYPYEWCFSQLKDAALATLEIQKVALEYEMSLKDASAFNIQFRNSTPLLIDTLSFERYQEGAPWVAYRQFCQHFLAPLALMSKTDVRLSQLSRVYIDGIPLDLASRLLPWRSLLRFSLLSHIHLHAKSQARYAGKRIDRKKLRKMSKLSFLAIIDSLESAVKKLQWNPDRTEWSDYYDGTNYSEDAFTQKERLIAEFLDEIKPRTLWDLGANTGVFSRIAAQKGIDTMAFDVDPLAVEKNYADCVRKKEKHLLPLVLDLTSPSPAIGWENRERMSLGERGPADAVLALALVHHLAIANNVPLHLIARFFGNLCSFLIIEFVPKADSQVQRLLSSREDIFSSYSQACFEEEFSCYFQVLRKVDLKDSQRVLFLMRKIA
jgi:hypothetical protein